MLDNTPNQLSKFKTKYWVKINDDSRGTCNINNQIKFDFSNAYLIVKGIIAVAWQEADAAAIAADRNDKQAIIENCAPFTDCISGINNTQVDNAKNLDVVMLVYDLIEYSNNYLNTSGSLWQNCRDEQNDNVTDSNRFKLKSRFVNNTDDTGTVNVK